MLLFKPSLTSECSGSDWIPGSKHTYLSLRWQLSTSSDHGPTLTLTCHKFNHLSEPCSIGWFTGLVIGWNVTREPNDITLCIINTECLNHIVHIINGCIFRNHKLLFLFSLNNCNRRLCEVTQGFHTRTLFSRLFAKGMHRILGHMSSIGLWKWQTCKQDGRGGGNICVTTQTSLYRLIACQKDCKNICMIASSSWVCYYLFAKYKVESLKYTVGNLYQFYIEYGYR